MNLPRILATTIASLLTAASLHAQTWDGGGAAGGNLDWITGTNWAGDVAPVNNATANIIFAGAIDNNPGPNLDQNWNVNSVSFNNTAGAFTLGSTGGFTLTIGVGGIVNNDTQTQTISHSVALGFAQTWNAANGTLSFSGATVNNAGSLLTIAGGFGVTINSAIGGGGGLTKTSTSALTLGGTTANTYSGTTTVNAGTLFLAKTAGVSAITGPLLIGDGSGTDTVLLQASNQIANTTVTVNSSGVFDLGGFSEGFLSLIVNGGSATIGTGVLSLGTSLTMTGGSVASTGAGSLLMQGLVNTNASATAATISGAVDFGAAIRTLTIADGAAANDLDLTANVSNGGLTKSGAGTLRLSGANTFASGLLVNAGTVTLTASGAAGAGVVQLGGGTLAADAAPVTLTNAVSFSADSTASDITFNGPTTLQGNRTLTVNTGTVTFGGVVSGDVTTNAFSKLGAGTLVLNGAAANTYTGTTFVFGGTLELGKTAGVNALASGSIGVGDNVGIDTLRLLASDQIADAATVNPSGIDGGNLGVFDLNGFSETIANLNMTGGFVTMGGGTLTITGTASAPGAAADSVISGGTLNLGGGTRPFVIGDGAAANDLDVSATVSNGGINKSGAGTLRLTNANAYSGGTTLTAGTLAVGGNTALGTGTVTLNGGTLTADGGTRTLANPISLSGTATIGGSNIFLFTGPVTITSGSALVVANLTDSISGVLGGSAPLSKQGTGTLFLTGSSANTFSNTLTVEEGQLALNKTSGNAVTASLTIVNNFPGTPEVRHFASNQIADTVSVSVSGGLLNLSGFSDTIGALTLNGGTVASGAGVLTIGGNFTSGAATGTGTVSGNLNLGGVTRTFTIADNAPANDVDVSAAVANGGITKAGLGTLRLSGSAANTLTDTLTVNAGGLVLGKTAGLNAFAGALTIGDGTGAVNSDVVTLGASDQIPNASLVTINNSGLLDLAGFTETLNEIVFNGGSIATGAGALRIDLNHVGVTTNASFRNATISGNIFLDGGSLFITTADGSAAIDLDISATISQGAFNESVEKVGPGLLRLSGNSTFAFGVSIDEGTLAIGSNGALGSSGELFMQGGTVRADGTARTIGSIFVANGSSAAVDGNNSLTLSGVLDLPAGSVLTKSQSGALVLQNPIPNWSGTLTMTNGTLNAGAQTIRASGVFNHSGTFIGTLTNLGTYNYTAGPFTGQLINQGTANFNGNFTASNGIANGTTINLGNGIVFTANGTGLVNDGTLTLSNSTLAGGGPLVNNNFLSGFGTIGGTGGFTNNGLISVSGGNLVIANSGANVNAGNIDMPIVRQLRLDAGLTNTGTITLASTSITGAATLTNGAGGLVTGRGTISAPLANSGGTLRADLGTLTVTNAFNNSGIVRAESGASVIATSITNQAGGQIILTGTLSTSGALTNAANGRITLRDGTGLLNGAGALNNSGLISGEGAVAKSLTNTATGEVRAESGKTLFIGGGFAPNAGAITLQGGTLDFATAITNGATGFISGRGTLRTNGIINQGVMAFSGGTADVFGDVTNSAGARIVTSGAGSVTTFYDDVIHNGLEIFTGASASTVFFGSQSGAGPFTGTGTVYFIGDLRPGNSPASVLYEGDLVFGGTSSLTLEIGGLLSGAQYDHLNIGGALHADGDLVLTLLGGFTPQLGDTFDLFDVGTFAGDFDSISAPALGGGNAWDFSALKTTGSVTVVPEPGIGALLATALGFLGMRRRGIRGARASRRGGGVRDKWWQVRGRAVLVSASRRNELPDAPDSENVFAFPHVRKVREGGTPSPARETRALPGTTRAAHSTSIAQLA